MKKLVLYAMLFAYCLIACKKETTFTADANVTSVSQLMGTWQMTRYQDLETKEDMSQPDVNIFGTFKLTFSSDSTAQGRTPYNSLYLSYRINVNKLMVINAATSLVGCNETWTDKFYNIFKNPSNSPYLTVNENTLTLVSENLKRKVTMTKI